MAKYVKDLKVTVPDESYSSGSVVSGTMSFNVEESQSYNFVKVTLNGGSNVHWTEIGSGNRYHSEETYVKEEVVFWTKEGSSDGMIGPGYYEHQFQFTLPPNCPSSFHGAHGRIRYVLEGRVGTDLVKFDPVAELDLKVNQNVPFNIPSMLQPARCTKHRTMGLLPCTATGLDVTVEVPRTGFRIGADTIPLTVTVENGSDRTITIRASIIRYVHYFAHHGARTHLGPNKTIATVNSQPIQPRMTTSAELPELKVPDTEPAINLSNIKLGYSLIVEAVIPRSQNLSSQILIVLGNVEQEVQTATPAQN